MTVALYLRISKDPLKLAAGISRQRKDCTALAAARWPGLPVVEYVDNDISASRYSRKPRPAFAQLCADIASGTVEAMVGWDFDRVFRQPRELEAFLDLCDRHAFSDAVTAQGDVDLTSHDGRLHARIMVAVAAKSSDDSSRRIRRANQDRREKGLHQGSTVAFGYTMVDRCPVVRSAAATLVRAGAETILAGGTVQSVADAWAASGLPGAPATRPGVRWTLLSPTLVARTSAGARGAWPAILTDEQHAELRALFSSPDRKRYAPSGRRRWWLTGLVYCNCGNRMTPRGPQYVCSQPTKGSCTGIKLELLHRHVAVALATATIPVKAEVADPWPQPDDDRLAELAGLYASGELTRVEWQAARDVALHSGRTAVSGSLSDGGAAKGRDAQPHPQHAWEGMDVLQRHEYASRVIDRVVVSRRVLAGPKWQPERVQIRWRR